MKGQNVRTQLHTVNNSVDIISEAAVELPALAMIALIQELQNQIDQLLMPDMAQRRRALLGPRSPFVQVDYS